jgi:two-component system sensor histidine kinase YesM
MSMLQNRSIRFKLLMNFVLIIIFCLLSSSLLGTAVYNRSFEETTHEQTVQMMDQVKRNIGSTLAEMSNIIGYLAEEEGTRNFFAGGVGAGATADDGSSVKAKMAMYEQSHPEIAGIMLVNGNDNMITNKMERLSRDPLAGEAWYTGAISHRGEMQLIIRPIGRNIKAKLNYSADQVLSFVKAVGGSDEGDHPGVILIDMNLDIIGKMIESVSLGKSGFIYITDNEGAIVYSTVNQVVYRIKDKWIENGSENQVRDIQGRKYRIMQTPFQEFGWRIVGVVPLDESLQVITRLQLYTVGVALVTLLLATIASWYFTDSIIRPVRKLRSLMRKVEEGELHLRFRSKSNDEIGELGASFNKMVEEINNLINMVYAEQKSKREAELKILQAQIKPHFLYNTLDTIQWMAQDRDAEDIVEIIGALTNLFRIGLSRGNEIIALSEELKHVESYLIIQMARYEGKLSYDIDVPDELRSSSVLKLILQPLVENSIYHGIKSKRGPGRIVISARQYGTSLVCKVHDEGTGITPERLEQVRIRLENEEKGEKDSGYGLFNTHERIRLSYGSSYGISIDSAYGEWTEVTVLLPLLKI